MLTTVHYLPITCFIILPFSFLTTYMISVLLGHCEAAWPYISDTGVQVPERCIFSQLVNLSSFLVALTIIVRYKQVEQQCRDNLFPETNKVFALNKWSLLIGLISSCGLSMVANFQETQMFKVHMIGASLSFWFGLAYCAIQTRLSYYMYPIVQSGLILARCRLILTILLGLTYLLKTVFGIIAFKNFQGKDTTHWKPEDGGYIYHLISAISEWISAMCIDFFILSFAHEFKFMSISSPKFYMVSTMILREPDGSDSEESSYGVVNSGGVRQATSRPPNIETRPG